MDVDFFLSCFEMQYLEQDYFMSKKEPAHPKVHRFDNLRRMCLFSSVDYYVGICVTCI